MDNFDLKKYLAEGRLFENKIQDYKDFNFVAVVKSFVASNQVDEDGCELYHEMLEYFYTSFDEIIKNEMYEVGIDDFKSLKNMSEISLDVELSEGDSLLGEIIREVSVETDTEENFEDEVCEEDEDVYQQYYGVFINK